jgi:uncharacterized protein YkwD
VIDACARRTAAPLLVCAFAMVGFTSTARAAPRAGGCRGAGAQPARLSAATARASAFCLVNSARARSGLRGFRLDRRLTRSANAQARDMARRHYFAHQRPGGPSLLTRVRAARFTGSRLGEAIAWGCGTLGTAAATVRAWLHSPLHRAILLSRSYTRAGIGFARGAPVPCAGGAFWVLDAGAR